MIINKETRYTKDVANKKLIVNRDFSAPVAQVWKAWTDRDQLEQWWAPLPWKARTKSMDFREGGVWLYAMVGPNGEQQWCRVDYEKIEAGKSFTGLDSFCDEYGTITSDPPSMHWSVRFSPIEDGTEVNVVVSFSSEADMEKIIELGFKEGFAAAHENLDRLLTEKV